MCCASADAAAVVPMHAFQEEEMFVSQAYACVATQQLLVYKALRRTVMLRLDVKIRAYTQNTYRYILN